MEYVQHMRGRGLLWWLLLGWWLAPLVAAAVVVDRLIYVLLLGWFFKDRRAVELDRARDARRRHARADADRRVWVREHRGKRARSHRRALQQRQNTSPERGAPARRRGRREFPPALPLPPQEPPHDR